MTQATKVEKKIDGSEYTYTEFPPEAQKLFTLFKELFTDHWKELTFGPCLDGAVYEIRLSALPERIQYQDGYLTVDTGSWHFHLCLGPLKDPRLEAVRKVSRSAFFESKNTSCVPRSYGLRLWNGKNEQMISVFFPNPYLNSEMKNQEPDWTKLALWERMKQKYAAS